MRRELWAAFIIIPIPRLFEFNIDGEKKTVRAGDTMLKLDGVEHGCVCRKAGILLDIFNPMREDFVSVL